MASESRELGESLLETFARLDAEFSRAAGRLGEAVPCRRGCSSCCVALFDIHPADALVLGRWLDGLEADLRDDVLSRARAIVKRAAEVGPPGWRPEDGLGGLSDGEVESLARALPMACPALGSEGECRAHAHRPAICRLQGIPWHDEASAAVVPDLCRLDPRQAELRPQPLAFAPLDAARWQVKDELAPLLGNRLPRGRSFVAEALVRWHDHGMLRPPCC